MALLDRGKLLTASHRSHPCNPLTTKTLPSKPNREKGKRKSEREKRKWREKGDRRKDGGVWVSEEEEREILTVCQDVYCIFWELLQDISYTCGLYKRKRKKKKKIQGDVFSNFEEFFFILSDGKVTFNLRMSLSNNIILIGKDCLQKKQKSFYQVGFTRKSRKILAGL